MSKQAEQVLALFKRRGKTFSEAQRALRYLGLGVEERAALQFWRSRPLATAYVK